MGHGPSSEAIRSLGSQEIFWNAKVHHRAHKSPPSVPMFSQANQVHALPLHLFKIHFNIIIPDTPSSSKWSLSVRFPQRNLICIYFSSPPECHVSLPTNPQS